MPSLLTKIKSKIRGGSEVKKQKEYPPPYLPSTRPSSLTPNASMVTIPLSNEPSEGSSHNLSFFERFPPELRRHIMMEAFSNLTLHMYLSLNESNFGLAPLKNSSYPPRKRGPHAQPSSWNAEGWNWWSCVCHRNPPQLRGTKGADGPSRDMCDRGSDDWCSFWPGEEKKKCFVGVMGWLRSCRQAYAETINILYGNNTIHVANNFLMESLPQFILPQRLATITSLEVRWRGAKHPQSSNENFLTPFLNVVLRSMQGLENLHLSLEDLPLRNDPQIVFDTSAEFTFNPFVRALSRLKALKEIEIALPLSFYDHFRYEERGEYVEPGYALRMDERLWRELPLDETQAKLASKELSGYWICLGQMDRNLMNAVSTLH